MRIKFKRDTSFRKQFFVPDSFAHPAKMDAQLLIWITEHYTEAGETILDPMAGSGTTMLACTLGRNVVLVELEEKFCKMMRDNWEQVKMRPQLGSTMGSCQIIQGDARQLEGLCDKIITSPPYADIERRDRSREDWWDEEREKKFSGGSAKIAKGYQVDKIVTSPPHGDSNVRRGDKAFNTVGAGESMEYGYTEGQIANLPYGEIDKCIFSPPYTTDLGKDRAWMEKHYEGIGRNPKGYTVDQYIPPKGDNQIGNLPYGQIDKIVTSPPFLDMTAGGKDNLSAEKGLRSYGDKPKQTLGGDRTSGKVVEERLARQRQGNIGYIGTTWKGKPQDSYLEAMLQVYQQCHKVLKPQGLIILVTKNFIRNKQIVRLDTDTIKLCEQAGFSFVERHYRELPSQSFWRVIYHQKFPDVEQIKNEDVLVFRK